MSAQDIARGLTEAQRRIQCLIDTYSIAGANLLVWLSEDDLQRAPQPRRYLFGLIRQRPSQREWEDWASDVACRIAFEMLRQAKQAINQQEAKDG